MQEILDMNYYLKDVRPKVDAVITSQRKLPIAILTAVELLRTADYSVCHALMLRQRDVASRYHCGSPLGEHTCLARRGAPQRGARLRHNASRLTACVARTTAPMP